MDRAILQDIELDYEVRGAGEPVVLVHAGVCADWFKQFLDEPALADRYRLLSYHRPGYANSGQPSGPVSIAQQAVYCRLMMQHVGIDRAHIVGHSNGGMIALQMALDYPDAVQSLVLLESARPGAGDAPGEEAFLATVAQPALRHYAAGDHAAAVEAWMIGTCGPDYRAALEQRLPPGAFAQAVADADTFFGNDLPGVRAWTLTREDAARITQPVLAVLGAKTSDVTPTFELRREVLLAWLPDVEAFDLPGATHLLHLQNPRGLAEGMAAFFERHPISPTA